MKSTEKAPAQSEEHANCFMRASRLHGIRDLRLEEVARPTPGPGEVLLQVASVGVCGSDVHYYLEGRIGSSQVVTAPMILGHEFSAWIAGLGQGVEGLEIGQLVTVEPGIPCGRCEPCQQGHPNLCPHVRFCGTPPIDGVFAEYTVMPADNCFLLPDGFSSDEGALLEPLGIAIHAVDLAHLKAGQTVAVLGAGPIGLLIAAVARAAGATEIYMTEPLKHRRSFAVGTGAGARETGANGLGLSSTQRWADVALDPESTDVVAEVLRFTGGRGVDVAFEAAGGLGTPQEAAAMTRIGGKVIVAGIPSDDIMVLNASTVRKRGLTIKLVRRMKFTYPRAIRLVGTGAVDVKPLATHLYPLERISEAFELVSGYGDGVLRAVIQVGQRFG